MNTNTPLLSFIIPVYNTEKYVSECLESILKYDNEKFEIIILDDGSSDSSYSIINSYVDRFYNLRLFHHENIGHSFTRNKGIKEARGKYVWFVDSDDLLNTTNLCKVIEILSGSDLDILLFNFQFYQDGITWRWPRFDVLDSDVNDGITVLSKKNFYLAPWNKIFNREFLLKNDLYFLNLIPEDLEYNIRSFLFAKKVKCLNLDLYYWRVTPNSLSKSPSNYSKFIDSYIFMLNKYSEYAERYQYPKYWTKIFKYIVFDLNNMVILTKDISALNAEKSVLKKILRVIPFQFSYNYLILKLISIFPITFYRIKKYMSR